jgi:hypothetical protein
VHRRLQAETYERRSGLYCLRGFALDTEPGAAHTFPSPVHRHGTLLSLDQDRDTLLRFMASALPKRRAS